MSDEYIEKIVKNHLSNFPEDLNYVNLLLENKEFSKKDKSYPGWLNFNLSGVNRGYSLIKQIEGIKGDIKGLNILDVGAGGGGYSIAFAKHGCKVTSIEVEDLRSQWFKTRVKDHGVKVNFIQDRLEDINFKEKYDLILCDSVLEHVDDWKIFLGQLLEISNGSIYLCWPNKFSFLEMISDSHYGLPGGSFLTGKLRWLQKYYIRAFGIKRNAWVVDIPRLSAVNSAVLEHTPYKKLLVVPPVSIDKIDNPDKINHTLAKKFIKTLNKIGFTNSLIKRIIISQMATRTVLIVDN